MTFPELLQKLTHAALITDGTDEFPAEQVQWLAETDVLRWVIPDTYGGKLADELSMVQTYEQLAEACLTTTFVLTQRNGACQRIAGCDNTSLKAELLPQLANGELFATVGISHLTTSRQHLAQPAVQVQLQGDEFVLNGMIPWVTGATAADVIVTGGTICDADGNATEEQVLIAMPVEAEGVEIDTPATLMALTASHTASVTLDNVCVARSNLLAGPTVQVMNSGKGGGAGSLTTSTLAIGLCARMQKLLQVQAEKRPELADTVQKFVAEINRVRGDVQAIVQGTSEVTATEIRRRINSLALRITQSALAITKGAGFVKGHPVELAVREAMFFLVWSCPQPVVDSVLEELACRDGWGIAQ